MTSLESSETQKTTAKSRICSKHNLFKEICSICAPSLEEKQKAELASQAESQQDLEFLGSQISEELSMSNISPMECW